MPNIHLNSEGRRTLAKTNRNGSIVLLMEAIEGESKTVWDHLDVASTVQQQVGHAVDAYTEKGGSRYVFVVSDPADAEKLKRISKLASGHKVKVGSHPTLNRVRCVISSKDIINVRDSDLLEQFAAQGVVDVHRIISKVGDKKVNTSSVVLTFDSLNFPERVKFGLLSIITRPYYALPLQCYNCYGFGHGKAGCKSKTRCRVCSKEHVIAGKCGAKAFCSNCKGNHQPTNRKCPIYVKEAAVLKLRTDLGIPYREAKKVFNKENNAPNTFAQMAKAASVAALQQQAVSLAPLAEKQKRKRPRPAKKPDPKSAGSGGANGQRVAGVGNKRTVQTKSVGVGTGPSCNTGKKPKGSNDARVGSVSSKSVGTSPIPGIASPGSGQDEEKQLLKNQVEKLIREVTRLKEKYKALKEKVSLAERESAAPISDQESVGKAAHPVVDDGAAPLTRRKRKQLAESPEATRKKKSRKKADTQESAAETSATDRESDAVTVVE